MASNRYIRQTSLAKFGAKGQEKLNGSKVLVVGLGGLGLPVAQYLNAMGVGTLGLVEQDVIELHNLQRQVLYTEKDLGKPKLEVAFGRLSNQNPTTALKSFDTFLTKDNALQIIKDFDLVVDATDNFPTRYLINDACVILNKPFVYGALHGFEGQVSVFNHLGGPTYRCLFPTPPSSDEIPNCDENGVLGVIPGIVGSFQALEAVKVLTGIGESLSGKLLLYDGLNQSVQKISLKCNPKNKRIKKLQESYAIPACVTINFIASNEFAALREKEKLQVVDVRSKKEFNRQRLDDTLNIPLPELEYQLNHVDFNRPVYLLCQSGQRSKMAYEKLRMLYPKADLISVSGGLSNLSIHVGTD